MADGIPDPRVSWTHISGSMPKSAETYGSREAVLRNLENGRHTWMCTATNEMGSDNVTVTFTGACVSHFLDVSVMKFSF